MKAHPTKHQLMAYAESLVDAQSAVDARLAGHIASCAACGAEVESIRVTLRIASAGPELEPSAECTMRLLNAARQERRSPAPRPRAAVRAMAILAKGAAVAAALAVVASLAFDAALGQPKAERAMGGAVVPIPLASAAETEEGVDPGQMVREIQTFAAAVSANQRVLGDWEREQLRSVWDLDAELLAATEALEQNPGCARATQVVQANLQRKVERLRSLYTGGN
jgi:anti-sigma factor RsiW